MTENPAPVHEQRFLASILCDLDQLRHSKREAFLAVQPRDFQHEPHRVIWFAAVEYTSRPDDLLEADGVAGLAQWMVERDWFGERKNLARLRDLLDPGSAMSRELGKAQCLLDLTGPGILAEIIDVGGSPVNAARYGALVLSGGQNPSNEITKHEDIVGRLRVLQGSDPGRFDGLPPSMAEASRAVHEELLGRIRGTVQPVATGFQELDDRLGGGLWPGLTVMVGRSGTMKTQLAAQVALHAAESGVPVYYLGLEMSGPSLWARFYSIRSRWSWTRFERDAKGETPAVERELASHRSRLEALPIHLRGVSSRPFCLEHLGSAMAQLREQYRQDADSYLLVIDYLQLVRSENPRMDIRERVAAVAYAVQTLAAEQHVSTLVLSSTARNQGVLRPYLDDKGTPKDSAELFQKIDPGEYMELGKESGEIEYASPAVLALAELEDYKRANSASRAQRCALVVAKARSGQAGAIALEREQWGYKPGPFAWSGEPGLNGASGGERSENYNPL